MKNLKSKLLASVAMLLVSTVMLTSASFAWFTISTAPEITSLTTQVVVNENLEIALAKGEEVPGASDLGDTTKDDAAYTWGNIVNLAAGDAATAYGKVSKVLRPAALSNNGVEGVLQYPTYGTDGRLEKDLSDLAQDKTTEGFGNLTGENGNAYGYYVDFWLRSNESGMVILQTEGVDRGNGQKSEKGSSFSANAAKDPDKVLAKNIKIAFAEITGDKSGKTVKATAAKETYTDGATTKTFKGDVVELKANEPKLIRMYVYLDGENVTNAAASLDGVDPVGGTLNVQFAMAAVTTPMNVKAAE